MIGPIIRRFEKTEWRAYRSIRLRALHDAPEAFASSYQNAIKHPDEHWINRLEHASADTDLPMAATLGEPGFPAEPAASLEARS